MELNYKELMKKAKKEAGLKAALLYPEKDKEARRREAEKLTALYYRQYTRP